MGLDGTQNTPHTLKTTAVSLLQTKKQHIAWLLGLVGVTIAAGSLAAGGISRATADIADTTINSTAETISTSASALTNLNSIDSSSVVSDSEFPAHADSQDASGAADVNVSVNVADGPAEVTVNGTQIQVPERGTSRQTLTTDSGNVNVSVSNNNSSSSDNKKSNSNSTLRLRSNTSTNETTKSVSR